MLMWMVVNADVESRRRRCRRSLTTMWMFVDAMLKVIDADADGRQCQCGRSLTLMWTVIDAGVDGH